MFGFLIGAACLVGLAKVSFGHRWRHHHFHGHRGFGHHGFGHHGFGHHRGFEYGGGDGCGSPYRDGPWSRGGYGRGPEGAYGEGPEGHERDGLGDEPMDFRRGGFRGFGLRSVLEELELTREQRKALRDVREEWKDAARAAKKSGRVVKDDLASALRAETFDESLVGASIAKIDDMTDALKKSTLSSLAKAHQVLDARQRGKLAEVLEEGPFGRRFRF